MEVILKILAEDIRTTDFGRYEDCAISKAVERAGYKGFHHDGFHIENDEGKHLNLNSIDDLSMKVLHMYYHPSTIFSKKRFLHGVPDNITTIEPVDFEYTITIADVNNKDVD